MLSRVSKLLENILSFALFTQFGVSGLVLCTCAYQLSVVKPDENLFKYIFSIFYSIGMLTEISVPSYFGSALTKSSERLPYSIFQSSWIDKSEQYKKWMRIVVERTLQPISVRAGSIFQLNLTTMMTVLISFLNVFIA